MEERIVKVMNFFKSGVKGRGSDMVRAKVMTVMRWYAQDESEQNEVDGMKNGADSTGKVMHI